MECKECGTKIGLWEYIMNSGWCKYCLVNLYNQEKGERY